MTDAPEPDAPQRSNDPEAVAQAPGDDQGDRDRDQLVALWWTPGPARSERRRAVVAAALSAAAVAIVVGPDMLGELGRDRII